MKRRVISGGVLTLLLAGAVVYLIRPASDAPKPEAETAHVSDIPWIMAPGEPTQDDGGDQPQRVRDVETPSDGITGVVQSAEGDPIVGAEVVEITQDALSLGLSATAQEIPPASTTTDTSGRFTLTELSYGTPQGFRLLARAEGFAPAMTTFIRAGDDVVIEFGAGAALSGRLLVHDTGEPIANQTIALTRFLPQHVPKAETDSNGWFFFANLAPWNYTAFVEGMEYVLVPDSRHIAVATSENVEATLRAAKSGAVEGRVLNTKTGAGVPGVKIVANLGHASGGGTISDYTDDPNDPRVQAQRFSRDSALRQGVGLLGAFTMLTDGTGAFRIAGLPPGNYHVLMADEVLRSPTFSDNIYRNVTIPLGGTVMIDDFSMDPGNGLGGRVTNRAGDPVAGAQVWTQQDQTRTDAEGRYRLTRLPNDQEFKLIVIAGGYARHYNRLLLATADPLNHDIVLGPEARMEGIIVDETGVPRKGLGVSARARPSIPGVYPQGDSPGNSARDGSFLVYRLQPGTYSVGVVQGSSPKQTIQIAEGETITGLRLVYRPEGESISGIVLTPEGEPAPHARVTTERGAGISVDEEGHFRYERLQYGTYTIWAEKGGYSESAKVQVRAGQGNVTLHLTKGASLSGRVVDAATGEPIRAYQITARGGGQEVRDAQGRFHISGVPTKTSGVRVTASGMVDLNHPIRPLSPGESRTGLVLRMQTSQGVSGTIVDISGQPVEGAQVFTGDPPILPHESTEVYGPNSATDSTGRFTLTGLTAGPARIGTYLLGYSYTQQAVTVPEGGLQGVNITLPPGVVLEGQLRRNGSPVTDYEGLIIKTEHNQWFFAIPDANGFYRNDQLGPGPVHIEVYASGRKLTHEFNTVLHAGRPNVFNIELSGGTASVVGTVLSAPGTPLRAKKRIGISVIRSNGDLYMTEIESDASGQYHLEGLPGGQAVISSRVTGSGSHKYTLTLADGEEKPFDFPLYGRYTIRCRIPGAENAEHTPLVYLLSGTHQISYVDYKFSNDIRFYIRGQQRAISDQVLFSDISTGDYTVVAAILLPVESINGISTYPDNPFVYEHITVGENGETRVNLSF